MFTRHNVKVEKFAERHYIKNFERRYKLHWESTFIGIKKMLENIDSVMSTDIIDKISNLDDIFILKMDFRVDGTPYSRKKSGNRCILSLNKKTKEIKILLVYHKNDLGGKNEATTWKKIIRDNYDDYDFCR